MNQFSGLLRSDREPFYTDERCTISEWFNHAESAEASLAQASVAPGVTTQLHALSITERYIVTQGNGLMELQGDAPFLIGPGDNVIIPPQCSQRVKNIGQNDLVFLCLCTPAFQPDHYINLETADTPALDAP